MENLIGKKVKGFRFDENKCQLYYLVEMNNYIGEEGFIIDYDINDNSYLVMFIAESWWYPAKLIEQHLID